MTGGRWLENTAKIRLRPPSTGRRYTMSALVRPVGGRAAAMLSIFTASTRPSDFTGSPVNGDSNGCAACGVGLGAGARVAFGALPLLPPPRPPTAMPATTSPATTMTETTTTTGWAAHARATRLLTFPSTAPLPPDAGSYGSLRTAAASVPELFPRRAGLPSRPGMYGFVGMHVFDIALRHLPECRGPGQPAPLLQGMHRLRLPGRTGPAGQAALLDDAQAPLRVIRVHAPPASLSFISGCLPSCRGS